MRTQKETITICKSLFGNNEDIRVLTRLCQDRDIKDALFKWWRRNQTDNSANNNLFDASDYVDEVSDDEFPQQDVTKLGPDDKGWFYWIDRDTGEVIRRTRNKRPKAEKEEQIDDTILYKAFQNILERYHGLNRMKDRSLMLDEICGIASSSNERNMKIYFSVLCVCGFIEEDTVDEIAKARSATSQSAEKQNLFVDTLYELPFGIRRQINTDIAGVKRVLDDRLFGVEEVKDQILEYVTLMIHSKNRGAAVPLLLIGPPGTGKTTIATATAEALKLPYSSFHLSGASDNAVFRGHHSSWSESTPGGIIRTLVNMECENFVCLLDEIDKAGESQHGMIQDIVSELVDPSQNYDFVDNFMGFGVDISRVLWVLTANDEKRIPGYLLDRCEIVHIREYSKEEREFIIDKYLLKQVLEDNYLDRKVRIDKKAVEKLSSVASLREVKRILRSAIARLLARLSVEDSKEIVITEGLIDIKGLAKKTIGFVTEQTRKEKACTTKSS